MLNTTAKELLNLDKNAFRVARAIAGVDFQKPYIVEKIEGKFTMNSIMKGHEENTVLFIKDPNSYRGDYLYIVDVDSLNKPITDLKIHAYDIPSNNRIHEYYRKADFEAVRKQENTTTYVIRQAREYCIGSRLSNGYRPQITDFTQRYKLDEVRTFVKQYDNTEYISRLELRTTDNTNTKLTYHVDYYNDIQDAGDIIDKSGYIVKERREDLKRRAKALRSERAKNAFKATDNTAIIKAISERIQALKGDIVKALENANTYDSICAVKEYLDYWNGLAGIFKNYESISKAEADKTCGSIADFNNAVKRLNDDITELAGKVIA